MVVRASWGARGRVVVAAAIVLAATGCADEFLCSCRPPVARVDVAVAPQVIRVGGVAQAVAVPRVSDGKPITSSKVRVQFTSDDPAVAAVDAVTGQVVGRPAGRAVIAAEAQGTRGADTVYVTNAAH
jgi:hypothetical protein